MIKLNDVILIKNPAKSRPYRQLGRVIELFPGDDNKIRSFWVKRGDRLTQTHSIQHLHPLEFSLTHGYHPFSLEREEIKISSSITEGPVTDGSPTVTMNCNQTPLRVKRTAS